MLRGLFIAALLIIFSATSAMAEIRCGWFENPSPQNAWFYDREGQWSISNQGAGEDENAAGNWPHFEPKEWVQTNGHYGYGCACMKVTTDPVDMVIKTIHSSRSKPLVVCRDDKTLNEPAYEE